ncbi:MAG: hypothetical protein U9R19_11005, partial [Bacteroidota bacterium]|nr:hypothetical protein [Bacteroidota bacterium]
MSKFTLAAFFIIIISNFSFAENKTVTSQTGTLREIGPEAPITISFDVYNHSDEINNGRAVAYVTGGTSPYTYKWSKQEVDLESPNAENLCEGKKYKLLVTDATGAKDSATVEVLAESVGE